MSQVIGTLAGWMLGMRQRTSKARLVITACSSSTRPPRGRRAIRGAQGLGLQAQGSLRSRGRDGVGARSRRPKTTPARPGTGVVELIVAATQGLVEAGLDAGPETIAWHLPAPPRTPGRSGHDQPPPDPRRAGDPRAKKRPEVLLHPLRGRDAERDLAVGLHPLPAHPPRRPTRRRRARSSPGSTTAPATHCTSAPPPGHRTRSCWPPSEKPQVSTASRLDADRQRHGLHRPPGRHRTPRRPQRLRATAPRPGTWYRRTADPTTAPPAARSKDSSRP